MQVGRVPQVPRGRVAGASQSSGGACAPSGVGPLRSGEEGVGEMPPSTRLQERAERVMTLYSGGHLLVLKDANRIVRNLSVNGTKPLIQQFEVRPSSRV